jgi:hypothetical protein
MAGYAFALSRESMASSNVFLNAMQCVFAVAVLTVSDQKRIIRVPGGVIWIVGMAVKAID